jgi:hypothetical protein
MSPLKRAAIIAAVALGPLLLYINACGNIHQSPCGVAAIPAVLLVVPTLMLPVAGSEAMSWVAIAVTTFIIATGLAWVALGAAAALRRRPGSSLKR